MAHIRKRQFQPSPATNQASITSFFSRIDPINPPADFDPYDRKHVPSFSQPLPDPVQSQLMNMGMRIRKSVPEGYKTHKTMPLSRMPPPPSSAPTKPTLVHSESAPPPSSGPMPGLYSKPSELMPMCGLHKVGGYSSQPTSSAPELSYTQSTLTSSSSSLSTSNIPRAPSTPNNIRKRSYDDEIEDELDAIFDKEQEEEDKVDVNVSPKSKYPFSHSSMPELNRKSGFVRPGSRPKARMRARAATDKMAALDCDTAERDFDDGDAVFLQPMDCD